MASFAVHRSRKYPNQYLITKNRNDFSTVPPEALDSLGEIEFIKETRDLSSDQEAIGASEDTIVRQVLQKGYYLQPGKQTDMP